MSWGTAECRVTVRSPPLASLHERDMIFCSHLLPSAAFSHNTLPPLCGGSSSRGRLTLSVPLIIQAPVLSASYAHPLWNINMGPPVEVVPWWQNLQVKPAGRAAFFVATRPPEGGWRGMEGGLHRNCGPRYRGIPADEDGKAVLHLQKTAEKGTDGNTMYGLHFTRLHLGQGRGNPPTSGTLGGSALESSSPPHARIGSPSYMTNGTRARERIAILKRGPGTRFDLRRPRRAIEKRVVCHFLTVGRGGKGNS